MTRYPGDPVGPTSWYTLPIVACASVPKEELVLAVEIHDWSSAQCKKCGHIKDFDRSCRTCRDVLAVIFALDSGADGVRVIPRNSPVKS